MNDNGENVQNFRDDFRKAYKEANPDSKGVKMVNSFGIHHSINVCYGWSVFGN